MEGVYGKLVEETGTLEWCKECMVNLYKGRCMVRAVDGKCMVKCWMKGCVVKVDGWKVYGKLAEGCTVS